MAKQKDKPQIKKVVKKTTVKKKPAPKPKKKPVTRETQKKAKLKKIDNVLKLIAGGASLRKALKVNKLESRTFYEWLNDNADNNIHYVRVCEERADSIFEEILEISSDDGDDEKPFVGMNHIQRDRLKIDARKWALSKMNPKKYGERIEVDQKSDVTISFKK